MAVSAEIRVIDTDRPYQEKTYLIQPTRERISTVGDHIVTHYEFDFEYMSIDTHHNIQAEKNTKEQEE